MNEKRQMMMPFAAVLILMLTLMGSSARGDLILFYDFEEPDPFADKVSGVMGAVGANVTLESGTPLGNAAVFPDGARPDNDILVAQGDAPVIGLSDLSCMAWVRRATVTTDADGICDMVASTNEGGFQMLLVADFRFGVGGPGNQWMLTRSVTQVAQDMEWHHYAVSVDRDNPVGLSMYIDGVLDSATDPTGYASVSIAANQDFQIGSFNNLSLNGSLDELAFFDTALSMEDIHRAMKGIGTLPELAKHPNPEDALIDVPRDVVLSWQAGDFAETHDVYLGTVFDDVNEADRANPGEVLISEGQDANSYDAGVLAFGQTYYWRVDEVNGAPDRTVFKGDVWSFEVEPFAIPVTNITATASSSHAANMGPENTINGVGLNEMDQHSTEGTEMWLSGMGDSNPSIQYEFGKPYKLHALWVWNSNQPIESFVGLGAKDVAIEYSADGTEWLVLEDVPQFVQAPSSPAYSANTTVDFGGVLAKYVKLTINAGYGALPQNGLSEVRFYYIPTYAREPQPAPAEVTDTVDVVLNWRTGREANTHDIYLGTDSGDLALTATVTENSAPIGSLNHDTTYYWQIVEVNEAESVTSYASDVWSFTTPAFGVVDSFDLYDDDCHRIFFAWLDGLGHNGGEDIDDCDVAPYNGNGTGAIVGHAISPFAEQTVVYAGGQSMPLEYDSGVSETSMALDGQDWTASGIQSLSLMFYGSAGNTGQLYVKINNTKVVYDGDAADIARAEWQAWVIDLSGVGGNLQNVTSLTIGVEGASAAGMLYIDEIRLYPKAAEYLTPVDPSTASLAGHWRFDEGAGTVAADASGNGNDGTIVNATWQAGQAGSALTFDGASAYVNIPAAAWNSIEQQATVSVWLYVDSAVSQTPFTFAAYQDPAVGNSRVMQAIVVWDNGNLYLDSGGDASGYDRIFRAAGPSDYADAWIHWAFVKNAETGEQKIYRNGTLWHSSTGMTRTMTGVTAFTFGANTANTDRFWNGAMDDFRLYNRELSQEEILWLAGRTEPIVKPF